MPGISEIILRLSLLILFIIAVTFVLYTLLIKVFSLDKKDLKERILGLDDKMVSGLDHLFIGQGKSKRRTLLFSRYNQMLKQSHFVWIGVRNIYTLTLLSTSFAYLIYKMSLTLLNQELAAILCAVWAFTIPYELVKLDIENEKKKVRKYLPHFFMNVIQVNVLTSDIQETLKHLMGEIKRPLNKHIKGLVKDLEFGIDSEEAFRRVKEKTSIDVLIRFYENVEKNIKDGTKLNAKLHELAKDAYSDEYHYQTRITENVGGFTSIIIIIVFGIALILGVNNLIPNSYDILRKNPFGQLAVVALIILSFIAVKLVRAAVSYKE